LFKVILIATEILHVEKELGTRHELKRIVVLLSKSITQEMTLYRLARRELS
jgi:hypothetical protein